MVRLSLFTCLYLMIMCGWSQTLSPELLGEEYYRRADSLYDLYPDSSTYYFEQATPLLKAASNWEAYVDCQNALFAAYYYEGKYDRCETFARQAFEGASTQLGADHLYYGYALQNLGAFLDYKGDFLSAIQLYQEALEVQDLSADPLQVAELYHNLGVAYRKQGDYDVAITHYRYALDMTQDSLKSNDPKVARAMFNLGRAFEYKEAYHKAIPLYEHVLEILPKEAGSDDRISALLYLSDIYIRQKKMKEAKSLLEKLEIQELKPLFAIQMHRLWGEWYKSKGNYEQALEAFKLAQQLQKESGRFRPGEKHYDLAQSHLYLAETYHLQQNWELAASEYQKALHATSFQFAPNDPTENPLPDQVRHPLHALDILTGKARCLQSMNEETAAFQTIQLAIDLIHQIRQGYRSGESKLFFIHKVQSVFEQAINLALQKYHSEEEEQYLHSAFSFSEQSKAIILAEDLQASGALEGIPDSLQQKENNLKLELAFYEKALYAEQLKENQDSLKIRYLQDRVFTFKEAYHQCISGIEKDFPQYYAQKYSLTIPGVNEVQRKLLNDRSALLEYFWGDSSLYIFAVHKGEVRYHVLPFESLEVSALLQLVMDRNKVSQSGYGQTEFQTYIRLGTALYDQLLASVLASDNINQLILVRDGPLAYLPFELLLVNEPKREEEVNYYELPYALYHYAVSYQYSANIWLKGEKSNRGSLDPYLGGGASL